MPRLLDWWHPCRQRETPHVRHSDPATDSKASKGVVPRWYFYKVVADPFEQMWSIHVFVRSGDSLKQTPLVICLMSKRKTRDYTAVSIFVLYNGLQSSWNRVFDLNGNTDYHNASIFELKKKKKNQLTFSH